MFESNRTTNLAEMKSDCRSWFAKQNETTDEPFSKNVDEDYCENYPSTEDGRRKNYVKCPGLGPKTF